MGFHYPQITEIEIPPNCSYIGSRAFSFCEKLRHVTYPTCDFTLVINASSSLYINVGQDQSP